MRTCIITGSLGLVGSHAVKLFADKFDLIVGVDNDQRKEFFGTSGAGNMPTIKNYRHIDSDLRLLGHWELPKQCDLIVHCAGQPSHDWATNNVIEDFSINCSATLRLLEIARRYYPNAVFIFCSTNKVYGDLPNDLGYDEGEKRFTPANGSFPNGFDEKCYVDNKLHSFFGCSKLAADLYAQEYGKHLGMKTGVFRAGCITGPGHGGAVLHGFLSYLVKCAKDNIPYTVYGYKGKQVRDQIHAEDLVTAFNEFYKNPNPGEVYNIGGGTHSNCSVLEAIDLVGKITGNKIEYDISDQVRTGDHKWWISDVSKFKRHYPEWAYTYDIEGIIKDTV